MRSALRRPHVLAIGGILTLGLVLRVWGAKWGLPFAYQTDEERLYVHHAVQMLNRDHLNPHYFQNPPLFSYILEAVYAVGYGAQKAGGMIGEVPDRGSLYLTGRIVTALIGTLGIWFTYLAGRRFFDTATALLAALVMAVGFLPVFYSHAALNNVPAMVAVAGSLIGIAGIMRRGRPIDYVIAGVGLGLAAATKYTAGAVLLPLITATILGQRTDSFPDGWRGPARGLCYALGAALLAFLVANPQAIFDNVHFRAAIKTQDRLVGDEKFGQDPDGGIPFYLFSFTWGLGWVPALAALGAIWPLWKRDRRVALVLVPILPLFIFYMGHQTRYFGRWMLPIVPIVCILAGYGGASLIRFVRERRPAMRPALAGALTGAVALALALQGLVYSAHNDRVLSQPHTMNLARTWMIDNVPATAGVITEPFRASSWDWYWPRARSSLQSPFDKRPYLSSMNAGVVRQYMLRGFCWVMTSSNYWGPALRYPDQAPRAASYWRALRRHGTVVYSASPWGPVDSFHGPGDDKVDFDYDFSYNFEPLAYDRPGPAVIVYRLHGGKCGPAPGSQS